MIKTLKLSPAAIREAILSVDDARLSAEDLVSISKQLPTAEEVARLCNTTQSLSLTSFFFSLFLDVGDQDTGFWGYKQTVGSRPVFQSSRYFVHRRKISIFMLCCPDSLDPTITRTHRMHDISPAS
jgi:hypothetical protein